VGCELHNSVKGAVVARVLMYGPAQYERASGAMGESAGRPMGYTTLIQEFEASANGLRNASSFPSCPTNRCNLTPCPPGWSRQGSNLYQNWDSLWRPAHDARLDVTGDVVKSVRCCHVPGLRIRAGTTFTWPSAEKTNSDGSTPLQTRAILSLAECDILLT